MNQYQYIQYIQWADVSPQMTHPRLSRNLLMLSLLVFFCLTSCDLNRSIDIDLPDFESEVVVECYLQPGQPYLLTLTESVSYFEPAQLTYVKNAEVEITYKGESVQLEQVALALPPGIQELQILRPLVGDSLFFYTSVEPVPFEYDEDFFLNITTQEGKEILGITSIPSPVSIDTIEWRFDDDDSLALTLTRFQDDPSMDNFYRRTLHVSSVQVEPDQDFFVDDRVFNGERAVFGSGFDYERGDTLIFTLYHITEDYFNFSETKDAAITANLSPFAQPAELKSNIQGGIGIFTGFSSDRQQVIIE